MKTKTKKPGKQRKRLYAATQHRRGIVLSAHLSSELKGSHNIRSFPVRTGDTVRVLRGDYKGFEGKVLVTDRKNYRVFIEGINREKADGTSIRVPIHPSKVEITRLNMDDKWRDKVLKRRGPVEKEKTLEEEPPTETRETKTAEEPSTAIQVPSQAEGGK